MTQQVRFDSKSGGQAHGALALPAPGHEAPAVVVVQEYWGVNDHVRSLVDRFAREGFVAVAPDLYDGVVARDAEEAGRLMRGLDWSKAIDILAGAVAFLTNHPHTNGRVGMTGFCLGGAITFAAATRIDGLAAAVPFYGIPPEGQAHFDQVRAPILAHFATRDEWAKPPLAEAIKKKVEAAGQTMQLFVYEADHAFMNDTRPEVYSPGNASLAWERTVAFLREKTSA